MKLQILNLKKKLLLVEIEQFDPVRIVDEKNISYFGQKMNKVGRLTDITESQFAEWVEGYAIDKWKNYTAPAYTEYLMKTAKESFFSKLEADGIYFENPLDKEKKAYLFKGSENSWDVKDLKRWQEAQGKVWNKQNCWLFEII